MTIGARVLWPLAVPTVVQQGRSSLRQKAGQGVTTMRKNFGLTGTALLIGVGATLVFGVARARQDNVNDECVGNVLVLTKALTGYVQDYDENFPPSMTG